MSTGVMQYGFDNNADVTSTILRSIAANTLVVENESLGGVPFAIIARSRYIGVRASSLAYALFGDSDTGVGCYGRGKFNGVYGNSDSGRAVHGLSATGTGVHGASDTGLGLHGESSGQVMAGVYGNSAGPLGAGVMGEAGVPLAYGVVGKNNLGGFAALFEGGPVWVQGVLAKGGGGFKIDDPRAPEERYLSHSFVESPEAVNIYSGIVTTDSDGSAEVVLPGYFEDLNKEYRYQLTVIGKFAQAIVLEEIRENKFKIKTDQPQVKVSWQVGGVRKDPFAAAYGLPVEEDKPPEERGTYLHPEVYGRPYEDGINYRRDQTMRENLVRQAELQLEEAQLPERNGGESPR